MHARVCIHCVVYMHARPMLVLSITDLNSAIFGKQTGSVRGMSNQGIRVVLGNLQFTDLCNGSR